MARPNGWDAQISDGSGVCDWLFVLIQIVYHIFPEKRSNLDNRNFLFYTYFRQGINHAKGIVEIDSFL
jgi:hypothetical protein